MVHAHTHIYIVCVGSRFVCRHPITTQDIDMNPQGLLALLVISISIISSFGISYASTFSEMPLPATKPTITANDTAIFEISKRRCGDCNDESFNFLYAHNIVRASLGEPVLGWSSDLEGYARWWADQRRGDCALVHSFPDGDFKLGENIFWGGGSGWTSNDAVSDWAGERRYYSYAANGCLGGHECLHYTQIVWRRTTSLGCARVLCDNGDVFITCNYYPPGNYEGERPY